MDSIVDKLAKFLARRGLKATNDRREVALAVARAPGHFDADDLFIQMRLAGSRIAKTTIYRTLPLLLDAKIVHRVPSRTKSAAYEFAHGSDHHDHLICLRCGKMVEFTSKKIEEAQDEACRRADFQATSHRLSIWGLCRDCRREAKGRDKAARRSSRAPAAQVPKRHAVTNRRRRKAPA